MKEHEIAMRGYAKRQFQENDSTDPDYGNPFTEHYFNYLNNVEHPMRKNWVTTII